MLPKKSEVRNLIHNFFSVKIMELGFINGLSDRHSQQECWEVQDV